MLLDLIMLNNKKLENLEWFGRSDIKENNFINDNVFNKILKAYD